MLTSSPQGQYQRLSATGVVKAQSGALVGFFVASGTPTLKLNDNASGATAPIILNTTAALTAGTWYSLPALFVNGLYATITGAGDITFIYN